MASRRRKPSSTPIPKWILKKLIVYERKISADTRQKSQNSIITPSPLNKNILNIRTEKSECTCGGENERCSRCGGSGFYTKRIIDDYENKSIRPPLKSSEARIQESNFSNDSRGGIYGIREQGRFVSNPLYDDHD